MVQFIVQPETADFAAQHAMSQAVATGRFIFGGASALDHEKMVRLAGANTIAAEVRICLDRLETILTSQGRRLDNIVKLSMFLSDIAHQQEAEQALAAYFGADKLPLCLILGAGLARDCRVEIDMIASQA